MKYNPPSLGVCATVIASCLAWIGGITFALVHFLDLSPATGWVVAGILGSSTTVAAIVILNEMRHAIDLTDYVDPADFGSLPLPADWKLPATAHPLAGGVHYGFRVRTS